MSSHILGLNCAGFNSSTVLLDDGLLIAAVEEERLIRQKRTRRFPTEGIKFSLQLAGIELDDLEAVAISWNPFINLETYSRSQSGTTRFLGELLYSVPNHLLQIANSKVNESAVQHIQLTSGKRISIHYVRHHLSHAANFYASPFEEAAILTTDAFGEHQSTSFSRGSANSISSIWSQRFPHSLGGFYSTFTEYLGFQPQGDEWKLMGASAFGDPSRFRDKLKVLYSLSEDPKFGFELNLSYFDFYQFHTPHRFSEKLSELLGIPPRESTHDFEEVHYDLASAAQEAFTDIYLHLLRQLYGSSKSKNVVVSGGCALNSLANGEILAKTNFENCFISPVPDDSGAALGAASYVYHQVMNGKNRSVMTHNYLGPEYTEGEVASTLSRYQIPFEILPNPEREAARLIASGLVIGWFQGRLEFGDRALGNRSILADPRVAGMADRVNSAIKYRENFRPCAPAVLVEEGNSYFERYVPTPFMERVLPILPSMRPILPAVTHRDGTGRLQTVSREQNPRFYKLISEFQDLTGIPIVLNTSFNIKGEPIVCSPTDALRTFFSSGLDALIVGNHLITKNRLSHTMARAGE